MEYGGSAILLKNPTQEFPRKQSNFVISELVQNLCVAKIRKLRLMEDGRTSCAQLVPDIRGLYGADFRGNLIQVQIGPWMMSSGALKMESKAPLGLLLIP